MSDEDVVGEAGTSAFLFLLRCVRTGSSSENWAGNIDVAWEEMRVFEPSALDVSLEFPLLDVL